MTSDFEHKKNQEISNNTLSAWQKANSILIKGIADINDNEQSFLQFQQGLHALEEFKTAQGTPSTNSILENSLTKQSPLTDYIKVIQLLSEQVITNGYYGLQDSCLLLIDALQELSDDKKEQAKTKLLLLFSDWPLLGGHQKSVIIDDDNFCDHSFETEVSFGIEKPENEEAKKQALEHSIVIIEQLAEQAAKDGYLGLQDVSFILTEALHNLLGKSTPISDDLLYRLDNWESLITIYRQEPIAAIPSIIKILQSKELNLPLSDEDFNMLEILLNEDKNTTETTEYNNSSILETHIITIEKLAEQAAKDGYLGLQDVSFILTEALRKLLEKSASISNDFLYQLDNWSTLIAIYRQEPLAATPNIIKTLQSKELNLPLNDEDFTMLEMLLDEGNNTTDIVNPEHISELDSIINTIEKLAEQAAKNGYFGLQDISLIVVEGLQKLSAKNKGLSDDFLATLNSWETFINAYRQESPTAILNIMKVLSAPDLELFLNDDEMATLKTLLDEGMGIQSDDSFVKPNPSTLETPNTLSLIKTHIDTIQQLAEQAALEGYLGLQDISLILAEGLRELLFKNSEISNNLLTMLDNWPTLINAYRQESPTAILSIMKVLSSPDLELFLDDDEMAALKTLLDEGINVKDEPYHESLYQEKPPSKHFKTYINVIEKIAEQATTDGYFGLQDVCFLIVEALYGLADKSNPLTTSLLEMLDNFPTLIDCYRKEPLANTPAIIKILRHPELLLPFSDDDFVMFENLLEKGNKTNPLNKIPAESPPLVSVLEKYRSNIEQLAELAAIDGFLGIQNASLLIVEALHELLHKDQEQLERVSQELLTELKNWPNLIHSYRQNPELVTQAIIKILKFPDLNLPLVEDDFMMLKKMLQEGSHNDNILQEINDDVVTLQTVIDEPITLEIEAIEKEPDHEEVIPLSKMAQELVELLQTEAGLLEYRFQDISLENKSSLEKNLQQAEEELERLANASRMVGFEGLAQVCTHVSANMAVFLQDINNFSIEQLNLLPEWIIQVKNYLSAFSQQGAGKEMLKQLSFASWCIPLTQEAFDNLLPQMQITNLGELSEEVLREKIATEEDVSLELPDDVNKELLDLLLQELPTYTQQFSEAIQRLQMGGTSKDLEIAQRIAHTIKGSANTVGIKGIAVLTHHIEDILTVCAKEHKNPGSALINTLINAADCLENMCEFLLEQGSKPEDSLTILQEVLDFANQIDKKGLEGLDESLSVKPTLHVQEQGSNSEINAHQKTVISEKPLEKHENSEKTESSQTPMVRVPTDQIENLFRLSSESIILNGQIYERHRRMKNQLTAIETQFSLLQQLGSELEQLIDLKDLSGKATHVNKNFDTLEMDQYNELHTASRRMVEASVDAHEISVDIRKELELMSEVLEYQQRLVIDTQEAIMQTRFVPVGSITLRLQRGLRQTCRLTGKQGELIVSGEELLIDGDTLSSLVEPIMHLLRNAIDHGLESEEQRIALGKPKIGKIYIDFDREGNSILVRCRDDGKGLDFSAIRDTAEKRGLIKTGETVSEEELKRFILRPNFSTRNQSTQTSGRGVGMDVVHFQVISMGGTLNLKSTFGQGLTVELRMPLPLSRSHALLAHVGPYKVAISSKGLTQILYSAIDDIKMLNNEPILIIGEDVYPVKKLDDLLHVYDRRKDSHRMHHGAVLLVQNEENITAVLVDSITDSRDVVIKNLGHYMRKIHGFVGATILGDGSVTPVLDVPELLRSPSSNTNFSVINETETIENHLKLPTVLIVEDSLSQRRALEQILIDAGFHVLTARDGIEAVELLAHKKPDVVLTDLEMPRMNGIELTSHIRSQTSSKNLPVIMVTSRSTEKHRKMAEEAGINFYLTKPVQDEDLLMKMQTLMNKAQGINI